jgi:hypothetical protein
MKRLPSVADLSIYFACSLLFTARTRFQIAGVEILLSLLYKIPFDSYSRHQIPYRIFCVKVGFNGLLSHSRARHRVRKRLIVIYYVNRFRSAFSRFYD